ncbi:MAG: SGNH/GDSL hydrolase family protein [Candidatus Sericytochromatia bacterium]|nr:SGNH/GDSL hydrolase family protein [Candidatus Sericytochromatia bacterium]
MNVKAMQMDLQNHWQRLDTQLDAVTTPLAEGFDTLTGSLGDTFDDLQQQLTDTWQDSKTFLSRHLACLPLVDAEAQAQHAPSVPALGKVSVGTEGKIGPGTRVLIVGDSQTVGPYGQTLDQLARATGATVSTQAAWGASPPWLFSGHETYKLWTRDSEGQANTQMRVATPLLNDLLARERPDVVIVTMGGNMIAGQASQGEVMTQVSQIGNAVSASGAELVWVGPPKYDPNKRSAAVLEAFYAKLRNAVPEYGTLIDSRPHISEYAGSDGLHYSGDKGERIAREWARGVFGEIQQLD